MRLLLHLVVLFGASYVIALWRARTYWRGDRNAFGVELSEVVNRERVTAMIVGARTQAAVEFEVAPETAFDRWAKRRGLAAEFELGEPGFDRAYYLATDDPHVLTGLRFDAELPAALRALLPRDAPGMRLALGIRRVRRLVCRSGIVRVELDVELRESDHVGRNDIIAAVARHLLPLAARLDASAGPPRPDRLRASAAWLPAIAAALALNGLVQLGRIATQGLPVTLEPAPLWRFGLPLGLAILVSLVLSAWRRMGRSSRTHHVLRAIALFGVAGALATGLALARDANIDLDGSPPRRHESVVVDRHAEGTTYYATVRGWPGQREPVTFTVDGGDYANLRKGRAVTVVERDGWLGARWMEDVEP